MFKHVRAVAAVLVAATFIITLPAQAFAASYSIKGRVIDAATGLALSSVKLQSVGPTVLSTTTDLAGRFELTGLAGGVYSLQMSLPGYDNTVSEEFAVGAGVSLPLTLAMQRTTQSSQLRTLARTTVTASASLQKATVIYKQVSGNTLQRQGITRAGDAIRAMGGVDNASSDSASYGDDVTLSIRGIGTLETVSLIDGHPVALGFSGGLNYEMSPSFALRAVNVVYGAGGGDLYGVDAIGGVIDMQTLLPTRTPQVVLTQGWGSFSKLTSSLTATGSFEGDRWGYALALGTQGVNGPIRNAIFVQPAAAFDISANPAVAPAVVAQDQYPVNSNIANRSQLYKLSYGLGSKTNITATAMSAYYWDNKTGNGDGDYLPFDTAMASANRQLANYTPPGNSAPFTALNPPDCTTPGTFQGTGTGGNAYGYGLNGVTPDGGTTCVTPGQWANLNTGWQGAGPAWQAFTLSDYQVRLNSTIGRNTLNIDGFTNLYAHTYDRTNELPLVLNANGQTDPVSMNSTCAPMPCTLMSNPYWYNEAVNNAGVVGTYSIVSDNNEFGFGGYYDNTKTRFSTVGVPNPSPGAYETSAFFRDSWHPLKSPLTTYLSAYFKHSTVTNTSFIDPRLAFVLGQGNDVYRLAIGQVSTQPALTDVFSPFSPAAPGSLNGNVTCGTLNDVGSGGNPNAGPERATDQEFSWGHSFGGDSSIQLSLYSETIFDQLYSQSIPVTSYPSSFFGPNGYTTDLAPYLNFVTASCGGTNASNLQYLSVSGVVNIGSGLAEGIDLQGRQRITPQFFIDYGYATNSSVPLRVPVSILAGNFTTVPGSQLPHIPLHKTNFALDYTFGKVLEARTETFFVASNNPKNLPAYNYTNLILSAYTGQRGVFTVNVANLFQQNAFSAGLIGHGYPLLLNPQFAAQENTAPLLGDQATEEFGLTPRTIEFIYSYKLR